MQYLDGDEVDVDLIFDNGKPVYGAVTDNWPTGEVWGRVRVMDQGVEEVDGPGDGQCT